MSIRGLSRSCSRNIPEPALRAQRYCALGLHFEEQGKYQKAVQQHFLALKFYRKAYGAHSVSTSVLHVKIAHCYEKLGEREKAAEHYQKAKVF